MILPPSKRTQAQQHQVEQMNLNEDLRAVYLLSQEFVIMLKDRQAEALDSWLNRASKTQGDMVCSTPAVAAASGTISSGVQDA